MTTGLSRVVSAQVADNSTLVIVVGDDGGFELFDATTGRLVASDPISSVSLPKITGVSAHRTGDHLVVVLQTADELQSSAVIRIPVSVPALKQQLCAVYLASERAG